MASCFSSPERRQGSPRGTSPERTAARPGTGCATAVEAAFFSSGSDAVLSPRLCGLGSPRSVSSAGTDARETPSSRGRPPRAPSPSSTTRSPRSTSPNIFPDPPVRNPVRVGGGFSDTPSRTREEAMSPEREEEVYVSLTDPGDMSSAEWGDPHPLMRHSIETKMAGGQAKGPLYANKWETSLREDLRAGVRPIGRRRVASPEPRENTASWDDSPPTRPKPSNTKTELQKKSPPAESRGLSATASGSSTPQATPAPAPSSTTTTPATGGTTKKAAGVRSLYEEGIALDNQDRLQRLSPPSSLMNAARSAFGNTTAQAATTPTSTLAPKPVEPVSHPKQPWNFAAGSPSRAKVAGLPPTMGSQKKDDAERKVARRLDQGSAADSDSPRKKMEKDTDSTVLPAFIIICVALAILYMLGGGRILASIVDGPIAVFVAAWLPAPSIIRTVMARLGLTFSRLFGGPGPLTIRALRAAGLPEFQGTAMGVIGSMLKMLESGIISLGHIAVISQAFNRIVDFMSNPRRLTVLAAAYTAFTWIRSMMQNDETTGEDAKPTPATPPQPPSITTTPASTTRAQALLAHAKAEGSLDSMPATPKTPGAAVAFEASTRRRSRSASISEGQAAVYHSSAADQLEEMRTKMEAQRQSISKANGEEPSSSSTEARGPAITPTVPARRPSVSATPEVSSQARDRAKSMTDEMATALRKRRESLNETPRENAPSSQQPRRDSSESAGTFAWKPVGPQKKATDDELREALGMDDADVDDGDSPPVATLTRPVAPSPIASQSPAPLPAFAAPTPAPTPVSASLTSPTQGEQRPLSVAERRRQFAERAEAMKASASKAVAHRRSIASPEEARRQMEGARLSWSPQGAKAIAVNVVRAKLRLVIVGAKNLMPRDRSGSSDPYVEVHYEGQMKKTKVVTQNLNPMWMQELAFDVTDENNEVLLRVWDRDTLSKDDFLGETRFRVADFSGAAGADSSQRDFTLQRGSSGRSYVNDVSGTLTVRATVMEV
ncbi:C2 domain-containing protein [Pseudoscourfieldia marina]